MVEFLLISMLEYLIVPFVITMSSCFSRDNFLKFGYWSLGIRTSIVGLFNFILTFIVFSRSILSFYFIGWKPIFPNGS